jgi:hypothetical protein
MTSEIALLADSLLPEDPRWEEFDRAVPTKGVDCPLTVELIEFAQGRCDALTADRVERHRRECRYCRLCLDVFLKQLPPASSTPQGETRAGGLSATAGNESDGEMSSLVLTGFATMFMAGRTHEALELLQPILPDILQAVGLEPDLCDQLRQFVRQRLEESTRRAPPPFPSLLRDFARERLERDVEMPRNAEALRPIFVRGALRAVHADTRDPAIQAFLQDAIDRGMISAEGLDLLRLEEETYATQIQARDSRRLINRVSKHERRLAELFGVN